MAGVLQKQVRLINQASSGHFHGNADHALNADGTPNTAHSTNPVPFIYVTEKKNATVQDGVLADVAPSILHIMGLEPPEEMTGKCLMKE